MTHRINSYTTPVSPLVPAATVSKPGTSSAGASAPVVPVPATDRVQLTGSAVQLQQADQTLGSAAPVEDARVSQIKQAIANGSYAVNAHQVAAKLSRFEWDLGAS